MALLNKLLNPSLFKPKWQHKDASVRKQALAQLTDEKILAEIANNDIDQNIRLFSLSKITSMAIIEEFLVSEHTDLRKQAQHQYLVHLLPNQSCGDLQKITNDNELVSIATFTDNDDIRLNAIKMLGDESIRLELACHNPVARVRLSAAQGITSTEALHTLMRVAQGKDKALYRFCKEKIASAKEQETAIKALQEKVQNTIINAEQLANSAYSPEYNGRLQLLKQTWVGLNESEVNEALFFIADQDVTRFAQAISTADATLSEHLAEEKAIADRLTTIRLAKEKFTTILKQFETLELNDNSADKLTQIEFQWQAAKQITKPEPEQHKQYENQLQIWLALINTHTQLIVQKELLTDLIAQSTDLEKISLSQSQALQKKLTTTLKSLPWKPAASLGKIESPLILVDLDIALQNVIKHNQALASHELESSKDVANILATLEKNINDGHLKEANKSHQQAIQALKKISQQESKKFQRQYQSLTAQLSEIRDWQGFAATPKKEALCDSMEALIGNDTDPTILADQIHILQEEWKAIGPIARQDDKILWNRFRAAADKAYEPCKLFYADMAVLRQKNLEHRQALIEQLIDYEANMDWDNADWGIVQKTLDAARETFRSFSPVDRNEHKASQASLQIIADTIYGHIKDEYQRNIDAKESLIQQAVDLQNVADLSQAIEQSKALQSDWKTIGITPNKEDQKLWKAFRVACDAVFARRDEQRQQNKATIEANIEQAEAIVMKAETIISEALANETTSPSEHKEALKNCQNEFSELNLPKTVYTKLRKRLSDVQQSQEEFIFHAKQAKKNQTWITLIDRLSAISMKESNTEKATTLYKEDQSELELPTGIDETLLKTKWTQTVNELSDESSLRETCIGLEIIAELQSPSEDQQARMAYQVKRLSQGLGQVGNTNQQVVEAVNNWLTLDVNEAWQERFNKALLTAIKKL